MSAFTFEVAMAALGVNGPDDADRTKVDQGWDAICWPVHEDNVLRLRQRIFKATREQDWAKVRNLQKLMLRSWSNTLLSVRQVTQRNAGRATAGVDGEIVMTPSARMRTAACVHRSINTWQPLPVKRVYIPKADRCKLRPLGIPVIMDRCHQARVRNALEPEWEARFEPKSYGFRPGRSCQDAIAALYVVLAQRRASRVWVLDADLAAAFDKISHGHLLSMLDTFPARELIRAWLAAGVVEAGEYTATWEGTPQGGVISPLLLNVAMHGLEQAAGVRYYTAGTRAGTAKPGSPIVVRYADDLVALCHSQEQAEQVKTRLAGWLAPRGLVFNETRTRIVHIDKGVNFLGFNIRRYHDGKLLIKPSAEAIRRVRNRLSAEMRALRGANAPAVLHKINPIVRGWAAYYRGVVSSRIFAKLDHHLWRLTYKWASYRHPNKPKKWIIARYFGKFHPSRQDQWVFGDRDSGAYLRKFAWTKIIRHQLVTGAASPDDPALTEYWNRRRRRNQPPTEQRRTTMAQLHAQRGTCGRCGGQLLPVDRWPTTPDEWGQWLRAASAVIAAQQAIPEPDGTPDKTRLIHPHCRNDNGSDPATQPDRASAGLA